MRLLAILMLACALTAHAAAIDPFVGQWALNPTKCKFEGGGVPKQFTVVYESREGGIRYRSFGIDANGNQLSSTYDAKFDGKEYPVTGSRPWAPVIVKRVDAHTIEDKFVRNGKIRGSKTSVVSKDGRTLTVTTVTPNGTGKGITNVSAFERK